MVICRNENLIKHAAEVALNNLTARENERRWGGVRRERKVRQYSFLHLSTISTLLLSFLPHLLSSFFSVFISFLYLLLLLPHFVIFFLPYSLFLAFIVYFLLYFLPLFLSLFPPPTPPFSPTLPHFVAILLQSFSHTSYLL